MIDAAKRIGLPALQQPEKALDYYLQAGLKDPLNGAYLQQIGMMLPKERQVLAERLVEQGSETTLHKDDLLLARVEWLLETGQRDKAIAAVRKGLEQNEKLVKVVLPLLQGFPSAGRSWLPSCRSRLKSGCNPDRFWRNSVVSTMPSTSGNMLWIISIEKRPSRPVGSRNSTVFIGNGKMRKKPLRLFVWGSKRFLTIRASMNGLAIITPRKPSTTVRLRNIGRHFCSNPAIPRSGARSIS